MKSSLLALIAVFVSTTAAAQQTEDHLLVPSDGMTSDNFGRAVTVWGTLIAVGSVAHDADGEINTGAVYVFEAVTGTLQYKLVPSDASGGDVFGLSVAMNGNVLAVGAPGKDTTQTNTGAVYLFEPGTGDELSVIISPNGGGNDQFGSSVAINGNLLLVGSAFQGSDFAGAAYLIDLTTETVVHEFSVPGSFQFGNSVGLADDFAIVGARQDAKAYVFDVVTGNLVAELSPGAGGSGSQFGYSVDVDGNRAIVGAPQFEANAPFSGAAFLYDLPSGSLIGMLQGNDTGEQNRFGRSVSMRGDQILIGAYFADDFVGAAYRFDAATGQQLGKLTPSDGSSKNNPWFGDAVALGSEAIVVGAPLRDSGGVLDVGAAYVYDLTPPDTDGDGLLDSWETDGLDINGDGVIDLDLPAMGADPMHKDLFLEVDVMDGVTLEPYAIQACIDAFANAPVENPDDVTGITVHIDMGTADILPFKETWDDDFVDFANAKSLFFGTDSERNDPNWEHIRAARQRVFRYAAVCNTIANAGGWGELPGNDFYMMAGGNAASDAYWQAVTFIHELGHNLGLAHGGGDPINSKPNYVSAMNYAFHDYCVASTGDPLPPDFSREALLPLIEDNLDETIGIDSDIYSDVCTYHGYRTPGEPPQYGWVVLNNPTGYDWNRDGTLDQGVIVDLNWFPNNDPSPGETMNSYNDWDIVVANLPIGTTGSYADGQHIPPPFEEETIEDVLERRAMLPPPPVNLAALNDLTVVFGDLLAGELNDLIASDQQMVQLRSEPGFSAIGPDIIRIVVGATTDVETPGTLGLVFEGRLTHPNGVSRLMLKNWTTNQLVQQSQFNLGFTEEQRFVKDIAAANYVRADDGRIEVAVHQYVVAVFSALGFDSHIDRIEISVVPE